jgi:iodotyrosine deiodinase
MKEHRFVPLPDFREFPPREMQRRSAEFYREMNRRRTVREFSDRAVPRAVIEDCLRTAGTAPSGAHRQPWHFAVVEDAAVKRRIREAAEVEERELYERRAPAAWLEVLAPLGTDSHKPFLETAPCLIVVFGETFGRSASGDKIKNYYVAESVGIATGLLIGAVHNAGLAALTHTPSPMRFLNEILGRPDSERPFLVMVVGFPAAGAVVPDLTRKSLEEISSFR